VDTRLLLESDAVRAERPRTSLQGVAMTSIGPTSFPMVNRDLNSRDFDYGVGDDLYNAVERLRMEIASRIRRSASLHTGATREERAAYELAARIAETH
jgi:hypothetical protein